MADFEQHDDFQKIASNTRYLQSIRDAVLDRLRYQDLGKYFYLLNDIKGKQQIGIIGNFKDVTRETTGCSDQCNTINIPGYSAFLEPKEFKICIPFCYADFLPYYTAYDLGSGLDLPNLGKSRLLGTLTALTQDAIASDFWKRVFLGSKDIASKDLLSDSTKAYVFDAIDGVISRLEMFKTKDEYKNRFIELTKNTDNKPYELRKGYARSLFKRLIRKATPPIKNGFILTSQALYWNYKDDLIESWDLESSKSQMQQGLSNLYYDRVRIIPVEDYSIWREEYFKKAVTPATDPVTYKVHMPHFALYTSRENLTIGMDKSSAFENLKYWYDEKSELFTIKTRYMMDFVMPNPKGFTAAI